MKFNITTVLFDLDGTLINTNPLIIKTFEETLKYFLPDQKFEKEDIYDFIGPTLKQTFDKLYLDKSEEMSAYYRKVNKQLHDDMVEIYPTVKEGLEILSKQYRLGIVSSKKNDMVLHGLKHCGIEHFFEIVIGADDVVKPKPDKEPLVLAMNMMNLKPHQVMYVGDNSHDIMCAHNAGVISCCVAWALRGADYLKQYKPDYILDDMRDLIHIIEEVNRNGN